MRQLPPPTPGDAVIDEDAGGTVVGDFTVPMAMTVDAAVFYALARQYSTAGAWSDPERRFARAAIVAAFASLEAQLNLTAAGHARAHGNALEPVVLDALCERETTVDDRGFVTQRRRPLSLTARLSFLTAFLGGQEFPRDGQLSRDVQRAVELRDECVHPRPPFTYNVPTADQAGFVLTTVTAVLSEMARLTRTQPQEWWRPANELVDALGDDDVPLVVIATQEV